MKPFRLLTAAALLAGACAAGDSLPSAPPLPTSPTPPVGSEPPPAAPPPPGAGPTAVLVGAGDISTCKSNNDEDTARLLDRQDGVIFTAGDNVYEEGTIQEFQNCYAPTWGRHLLRTRPSPGNHEYDTPGAAGYYSYFGANAGPPGLGYYSYELAGWHIISLNNNVAARAGSPQYEWLSDLDATSATCAVAYWHHPLFSSGDHGNYSVMRAIWRLLYDHGVEIVISGHDHDYERFAPQTADGQFDSARGIRSSSAREARVSTSSSRSNRTAKSATRVPTASSSSRCDRTATTGSSCLRAAEGFAISEAERVGRRERDRESHRAFALSFGRWAMVRGEGRWSVVVCGRTRRVSVARGAN